MGKRIDLVGRTFNKWRVLEYAGDKKFKCECLGCGNLYLVDSYKLRNNLSKQCAVCSSKNKTPKAIKCSCNLVQTHCIMEIADMLDVNNIRYTGKESNDKMSYDFELSDYKMIISFIYSLDYINDKKRNQNLTIYYRNKSIRLINIFEYEWRDANKKNKIANMIIRNTTKTNIETVYARNTEVAELDNACIRNFLDENHLQGYIVSQIALGLIYKNEIIAVMTFGKPRFGNDDGYELLRLAFKSDIEILGGSEKLFKYFINRFKPYSIISFCAITKFTGRVYNKLGFNSDKTEITSPNYQWVDVETNTYLPRYKCMKHKLIARGWGTEEETEDSIMRKHGYVKVFDSGNEKYTWYKNILNSKKVDSNIINEFDF